MGLRKRIRARKFGKPYTNPRKQVKWLVIYDDLAAGTEPSQFWAPSKFWEIMYGRHFKIVNATPNFIMQ